MKPLAFSLAVLLLIFSFFISTANAQGALFPEGPPWEIGIFRFVYQYCAHMMCCGWMLILLAFLGGVAL